MALANRIGAAAPSAAVVPAKAPVAAASFRREGEYWSIEFGSEAFRLRDAKGMRHIARLLGAPGREIHALQLAQLEPSATAVAPAPGELSSDGLGDAGPVLDETSKTAYRDRLKELSAELSEAEDWNDTERADRLRTEQAALTHELAAAFGIGGRNRIASSVAERARLSVTRAIRATLARVAAQSQPLGDHFDATIRTGTFCSYVPDPRAPITWSL